MPFSSYVLSVSVGVRVDMRKHLVLWEFHISCLDGPGVQGKVEAKLTQGHAVGKAGVPVFTHLARTPCGTIDIVQNSW